MQVGTLATWAQVVGGRRRSIALTAAGTLWGWGVNEGGVLGDGTATNRNSPVQVGTLATWSQVAGGAYHTLAIKTDNTLWEWGKGHYGGTDFGNSGYRSSPVQLGTLATWSRVAGVMYASAAIKTDGTLWTLGHNGAGELGLGDTVKRSSPVQVGTLATWSSITAGPSGSKHFLAIKTDGTMWGWGNNTSGQLGQADVAYRSSPVQVGTLNTWNTAAAGHDDSLGLR